jgi:outer membrane protein insertion porin family/translocation and assembly module TamA
VVSTGTSGGGKGTGRKALSGCEAVGGTGNEPPHADASAIAAPKLHARAVNRGKPQHTPYRHRDCVGVAPMGRRSLAGHDDARLIAGLALVACACKSIPAGRAALDGIDFEGVHSVSQSDLSSKIASTPSPRFLGVTQGLVYEYSLFDPFVLRADILRVERYYHARGYYEARVRAARVVYEKPQHVRVTLEVDEGPLVVVRDVRIRGADGLSREVQADLVRAVGTGGMSVGVPFDEDRFAGTEWHLRRALADRAYAFAKVVRSAQVDLVHHAASVRFDITPDQPATFGPITVTGFGELPEGPIRRTLDLHPGKPYSATALDLAQQSLTNLGVFGSVAVRPEIRDPPPPDRVVPVSVEVAPTKLRSVRLGGGFELDVIKTDAYLTAGWTDLNLFGGLRRFDVDFRPGVTFYPTRLSDFEGPRQLLPEERFTMQLRQPALFAPHVFGFLRGDFNIYPVLLTPNIDPNAPVVGYREARGAIGVERSVRKLYASLSYNLQFNSPFTYLGELDPDLLTVLFGYVDLLANLDLRDNSVRPHQGFFLGNDLQVAGGAGTGSATDIRVQPQARAYFPVGAATLAVRATTGLLFPFNYAGTLQQAPPGQAPPGVDRATWIRDEQLVYFRGFFSGGPTSNRGYPIYGVGPHGPIPFFTPAIATQQIEAQCVPGTSTFDASRCALPLGGLTLWELSAEVRVPISPQFEEATFCDASDVEIGEVTYRFDQPHLSCGVGLRYLTPVGPVRLDVGYRIPGLNPAPGSPDDPGNVLGLPIGVAFGIGEAF